METVELRSKEEITRDIEATRRQVKDAFKSTKYAVTEANPAVRAWKVTKRSALSAKDKTVAKACDADAAIRGNIYKAIGIAAGAGAVVGLFLSWKRKKARNRLC